MGVITQYKAGESCGDSTYKLKLRQNRMDAEERRQDESESKYYRPDRRQKVKVLILDGGGTVAAPARCICKLRPLDQSWYHLQVLSSRRNILGHWIQDI
ncbi:hypothetical protein KQX54_018052 [Cotesia glomerata]|uniref:Uncharacterized protein n=1 Tax=Cotesia glomerata TaxID=32391 RepID=A0AAV7HVE5_COTGL|nr:hypothetical protein KQX54_018052 [Cotesia glomerata]